jgi:hypothetical protein
MKEVIAMSVLIYLTYFIVIKNKKKIIYIDKICLY